MKVLRVAVVAFMLPVAVGCSAVYVDQPIGDRPARIEADDWEGVWITSDGDVAVAVASDREAGILWLADVEEHDGEPVMEKLTVHLRQAAADDSERLLASVADGDQYFWVLVVRDGDYVVAYDPVLDEFRDLVEQGVLPGSAADGEGLGDRDVYLRSLGPGHLETILANAGSLFAWDRPHVLQRMSESRATR